jgi:ribosomal protein S18 acetylase RimI-like enzyme
MEINIEPLGPSHNRSDFDCGVKELNNFLKKYSFQNQKNYISKTFVAIGDGQLSAEGKKTVLGFYTLSTGQINFDELPEGIKHPRYPVSIARLARLAVDIKQQEQGLGGFLLHDALQKIKMVSQVLGIFAIVVDAKDTQAKSFYERYGFVSLQESDLTLCLPMKVIDQL